MSTRTRKSGQSEFTKLLEEAKELHDRKSHDYTNGDPYGNYYFAGLLSKLFDNPDDSGFVSRIGEKLYRLSVLENKSPKNESVGDTEIDLVVIMTLWMASRRDRRK
jgi:hypothetical protein